MNKKIVKADPEARKRALILFVLITGFLALFIWKIEGDINRLKILFDTDVKQAIIDLKKLINMIFTVILIGNLLSSIHSIYLGWQVIQFRQFPPPGRKVIRDTPISTGKLAIALGLLLIISPILVFLLFISMYIIIQILINRGITSIVTYASSL